MQQPDQRFNHEIIGSFHKELLSVEFKPDDSFQTVLKEFYKICRRHGIKEGDRRGGVIVICNPEWIGAWMLFKDQWLSKINFFFMTAEAPRDLKSY